MKYLKNSILLCEEQNNANQKLFTIVKKINRGSSVVCYEAYHEGSGRGILKEFYPNDTFVTALKRNSEGQLILSEDAEFQHEHFRQAEREYLEPYKRLLSTKQDGQNRDLDTFIPTFEIYRGCNKDGKALGTVYIWSPEPELETFDKICDEIHKNPTVNPEQKLATVLTAIEALVKCVEALHRSDIIHRDIKPSNFGFLRRGNEILTQTISLFDINSMCDIFAKNNIEMGTVGYWEPEAKTERASVQTDIYSIGATLFHAIIITDEVKENKYLFKEELYDNLQELVNNSKLIQASEANSHPHLRKALATILQKCLCEREFRYENCEDLRKDVEDALYYALPSEIAKKMRTGQRWVLADAEKEFDRNADKNSALTIKYHLYEHPLYSCTEGNGSDLNILIFGFGNYGQKFLDACLQAGQMRGQTLNVTVVSDNEIDKSVYLSERPSLGEFFNIDGGNCDEDVYGNIVFESRGLNRINRKEIESVIQDTVCEHYDNKKPNYIFIALGDDKVNLITASACYDAVETLELNSCINYVCEDSSAESSNDKQIYPVYVNEDVKQSLIHAEIERMAFNTHLIWEKNLNIDFGKVRARFRKPYNHDASVSSVLSIKYKLFSMGIDMSKLTFEEAARLFRAKITDKSNKNIRNELIWIEHRRWVTEKICLGWRRINNLEECVSGITKDERTKRHVCILRSNPEQSLSTPFWSNNNFDKWDTASNDDLSKLDELERMSVELHRMYAKQAERTKKDDVFSMFLGIRPLVECDKKSIVAFQEWYSCLKEIRNNDLSKVKLNEGLKNAFLNAIDVLPQNRKKAVIEQVKAFESMFYPILACVEHRDWKQDDVALVDNIPFILTYTEEVYMVIPYSAEEKNVFNNVASATVVNPSRILYLYLAEKPSDISNLMASIPYTMAYMKKKRFKAGVEFIIAYTDTAGVVSEENLSKEIKEIGKERIRHIKMITLPKIDALPDLLDEYLSSRAAKKAMFAIEKNNTNLSSMLRFTPVYKNLANYEFSSVDSKFESLENCDLFGYIKRSSYITVSDMISLGMSSSESSNQPQFYSDYMELWKKYLQNSGLWKQLCDILGEHSKKSDVIVSFKKKFEKEKAPECEKYTYFIPFACRKGALKVMDFMKKHEILEHGSKVIEHTTDSCKVIIKDRCGYQSFYDKLFSNIYALMLHKAITPHLNTKSHEVNVVFDNLQVKDVVISGNRKNELLTLLKYFAKEGYIINLVGEDEKVSFTYATNQIKELLTTAGKILEIYTYHKVKELGKFDDVVSSYEIDWEDTEVKNELDCIITKGFRTMFIECKARTDIEQEFYFKIGKLAEKFGVNPIAVLIADTQERSFYDNAPVNTLQRKRGSMIDVVTIWKPDEIANIGHTLLKIFNGKYNCAE